MRYIFVNFIVFRLFESFAKIERKKQREKHNKFIINILHQTSK